MKIFVLFVFVFCDFVYCQEFRANNRTEFIEHGLVVCKGVPRPTLEKCIVDSIHNHKDFIVTGVPEVKLPSLEPFSLNDLEVNERSGDNVLSLSFKNITIKGIGDFHFDNLTVDYKNRQAFIEVSIPEIRANGRYSIGGTVYIIPIHGKGTFWLTLRESVISARIILDKRSVNNATRLQMDITPEDMAFDIGDVKLRINNLFDGDPILTEAVNAYINGNAKDLIEEFKPRIIHEIRIRAEQIGNNLMGTLTLDQIPGSEYLD